MNTPELTAENGYRLRAKLLITLLPGVHLRELQRLLAISFSSTRYHVDGLSKAGDIDKVDEGGYTRLYPPGTGREPKLLYSALRQPTKRRILSILAKSSGLTNKQLSDLSGLAKSTVSEQLKTLTDVGIVQTALLSGTGTMYKLKDVDSLSELLSRNDEALLKKARERFIDLWDF